MGAEIDVAKDGGGRRTAYKSFKGSKREAQAELTRLLAQADEGNHIDPSKLDIEKYLRARFEHCKATKVISPITAQRYGELIDLHIVPYLGAPGRCNGSTRSTSKLGTRR